MMDMLKKLVRFIGLDSSRKIEFDSFIIGLQVFLVFDLNLSTLGVAIHLSVLLTSLLIRTTSILYL